MKLVSIDEYRALESYSATTIYLCYEDESTKRVTRIFVGEDRVYAAGVKVTYQIDTGYSLERTVPDREDAIAAARMLRWRAIPLWAGGRMILRKRRCFPSSLLLRKNQSPFMRYSKSR